MTTPSQMIGANLDVRATTPTIHLSPIIKALTELISSNQHAYIHHSPQNNRLVIDTKVIIEKFLSHNELKNFEVIADLGELPKKNTSATLGGNLFDEPLVLSREVDKLSHQINTLLANTPNEVFQQIALPDVNNYLNQLSLSMVGNDSLVPKPQSLLKIQPIAFTTYDNPKNTAVNNVARVFYAKETINAQDWLDTFKAGIESWMSQNDYEEEVIDDILNSIDYQKDNPDSQMANFINFLDDMALSRVRLQVVMDLMQALAKQSNSQLLKNYIDNIRQCYELFASQKASTVTIDVSKVYGSRTSIDLMSYLNNIYAYGNLPVWAVPSIQLFENINENIHGFATVRDVCYQFKVNGKAMQSGEDKTAFINKLDKLEDKLFGEINEGDNYTFDILELIFLALVIPSEDPSKNLPVKARIEHIQANISSAPQDFLKKLFQSLRDKSEIVDKLASALIDVIKDKSKQAVQELAKNNTKYILTISKEIVNTEAIESSEGEDNIEILEKSQYGRDSSLWLSYIKVLRGDDLPENPSLVSYEVQMQINEKSISKCTNLESYFYERVLSNQVLPIRLLPIVAKNKEAKDFNYRQIGDEEYIAVDNRINLPDTQVGGIDVHYWFTMLNRKSEQQEHKDAQKIGRKPPNRRQGDQFHTTCLVALNILMYVTLSAIVKRVQAVTDKPLAVNILRIPCKQNPEDMETGSKIRHSPDDIIYACSRALEKALCRDTLTRAQGLVITSLTDDFKNFKKKGIVQALLASQPLLISRQGSLDKIAVIVYVTRPADVFPNMATDKQGYIFISKTFTADAQDSQKMLVNVDNMRTHLINKVEDFDQPPILNEIARLSSLGYKDIVLVSHHVHGRKIGRTANRHIIHLSKAFLEQANQKFEDVNLYPLIREEFSAVRLKKRYEESAFEAVGLDNHQALFKDYSLTNRRELTPLYTFATLHVIGNNEKDKRPQSGFSTYFFNYDSRVETNKQKAEITRANALGLSNTDTGVRDSIVSILRSLHVLECEKSISSKVLLPVLEPFSWVKPKDIVKNGEVLIMSSKRKGKTQLSLPAVLSHVSSVLHKD